MILRDLILLLFNLHPLLLSCMIDETTDELNKEQVVICFCWLDNELDVHKDFIGVYETESTEAIALLTIIHDLL